jgi:hypothetical protein
MNALRAVLIATALLLALAPESSVRADEPIMIPSVVPAEGGATPLTPAGPGATRPGPAINSGQAPAAAHSSENNPLRWHQHYDEYFRKNWGAEILGVRSISSGWMLEFKYRILDADKAALLNEKRARAFIIDEATDTRLSVPAMENIGELRQAPRPEPGRIYYILFGNPGQLVKKGGHVDVVVGRFRADGIIVE